jgi:AraC-like DNA-binding protein
MVTFGTGRILFWEGASLWLLAAGPEVGAAGFQGTRHAHHAVQVTFALAGRFELESAQRRVAAAIAAVAPDVPHAIRASGMVAFLYVEPESHAGRAVVRRLFEADPLTAVPPKLLGDLPARLAAAFADPAATDATLTAVGRAMVERLAGGIEVPAADPRVQRVTAWLATRLDRPVRLAEAAALVALSPERLRHLFVQQTGLPFRTYLLWLRLLKAVAAYAAGAPLTEAAHGAGFADSAHFSRTFRRMFGVAAAALRVA